MACSCKNLSLQGWRFLDFSLGQWLFFFFFERKLWNWRANPSKAWQSIDLHSAPYALSLLPSKKPTLLEKSRLRNRLHEDDVKTIGTKSYLSGKKSFRIGLLFTRRRSVSGNFWRRYEDDRKSGNFWRRYGNDRPLPSCKHHIRIDRSGSYQIVIAMRWPRTQASQSCIFSARVGVSCWRVGLFSESIPSFEARSWEVVAMRHKEERRRAAAGLLISSIVAQALLLLLFKALYSTSAGDQELSTTEEKSRSRY